MRLVGKFSNIVFDFAYEVGLNWIFFIQLEKDQCQGIEY